MRKVLLSFAGVVLLAGIFVGVKHKPQVGPEPGPCPPYCGKTAK
jgi:hypothetical protein